MNAKYNLLKKFIIAIVIIIMIIVIALGIVLISQNNNQNVKNVLQNNIVEEEPQIITRKYNEFKYSYISNQQIANIYFTNYISRTYENIEEAYDLLDEEYKQKRFGSIEEYKKYIDAIGDDIFYLRLKEYKIKENNGKKQIICLDQNGDYYIFNETAVMQYSVLLDPYTVEVQSIKEEYEALDIKNKVTYCVKNYINSIKKENYQYAYSVLSQEFKNNYFSTIQIFTNYMKQIFNNTTSVTYSNFRNEGEIYLVDVQFKNGENIQNEKTLIIKLNDGMNFELSFNV